MNVRNSSLLIKAPLFLVIVLDAIGFGIVTPVLAPLIKQIHGSILGDHAGLMTRHLIYGGLIALYPISFIIGAPILGSLSDKWGRKQILMISLLGSLLGFVGHTLSFQLKSLILLIVGRILTGLTAGSQGIAQAAMADISTNSRDKAINIGLIAIAMTLGLVLGPLLGGILTDSELVAWFGLSVPFYCVTLLCIFNLILLFVGVQDTQVLQQSTQTQLPNHFRPGWSIIASTPTVISLLTVFLLFELGWTLYYQTLPIMFVYKMDASQLQVGLYLAYVGIMLCIGLFGLVRLSTRRFSLQWLVQISLFIGGLALIALLLLPLIAVQFILAIPITFAVALIYTGLITLLSNRLSNDRQGLLMGITDGLIALAFTITGLAAGYITVFSLYLPFAIAGFIWLGALAIVHTILKKQTSN